MASGPDDQKPNINPFAGMFEGVLTPDTLKLKQQAESQQKHAQRMATMKPQNLVAMQFGEALGSLIKQKAGWLTAEERRAASNGEVMAKGRDRAMEIIREKKIPLGTPEAQLILNRSIIEEAFEAGNLEVADAAHERMSKEAARQAELAKTKAETENYETDNKTDRMSLEQRQREFEYGQEMDAKRLAIETEANELRKQELAQQKAAAAAEAELAARKAAFEGADALRGEMDKQLEGPEEILNKVQSVNQLAAAANPSADAGLIMAALKVFDPGARVTDQDFSTMKEAEQYITAAYEDGKMEEATYSKLKKYMTGASLTPKQRAELVSAVRSTGRQHIMDAQEKIEFFTGLADKRGVPVDQVISGRARTLIGGLEAAQPFTRQQFEAVGWGNQDALRKILLGEKEVNDAEFESLSPDALPGGGNIWITRD